MMLLSVLLKKLNNKINKKTFITLVTSFWDKDFKSLSLFNKLFFSLLVLFEQFYRLFFFAIKFKKKFLNSKLRSRYKVISVGNLSCGGTGKSVFVSFIIKNLKYKGSIILRGHLGQNSKKLNSFLVCDDKNIYCDQSFCGDEAFMFAKSLKIPVVVGRDRRKSANILENKFSSTLDYIVLDDAYQNYGLIKDLEILILDARFPFGNGHCLPAGSLREKDLSRADIIIFTHADFLDERGCDLLYEKIPKRLKEYTFFGKHSPIKLVNALGDSFLFNSFSDQKFITFAGIGSFSGFLHSLEASKLNLLKTIEFEDHHKYSADDFLNIISMHKILSSDGIITTFKDWVKLDSFIKNLNLDLKKQIYFLDIDFEFLNFKQKEKFFSLLERKLFINF